MTDTRETAAFEALVEKALQESRCFDDMVRAVIEEVLTPPSDANATPYTVVGAFAAQRAKYLGPERDLAAVFAKVAASTRDQHSYAERRSGRERRQGERRRKNFLTDRRSLPQSGRRGLDQRRRQIRRRADREDG